MKYFSLFTGAGGFEQGMPEGWECVGFSEIDKYCNMVLRYHYPDVKNYGDVNGIDWTQIPDFDLLVGGSPCQDLSVAGKRKGLSGERSGLFFAFAKALRDKLPDYFIWENVKGALSSNEGWDFTEVLNQFSDLGYTLSWQVLNAKDFGVPQNRERIFIYGARGDNTKEVLFEQGSNNKITENATRTLVSGYSKIPRFAPYVKQLQGGSKGERIYDSDGIAVAWLGGGLIFLTASNTLPMQIFITVAAAICCCCCFFWVKVLSISFI